MATLGPYELNSIITGDARQLTKAIPDESVDLIFTDPVYDRIDDYRWLAETAARVLKPNAALLCWSNGKWHRTNSKWLESFGLIYRYDFVDVNLDRSAPMNGKIISKANRVLWFDVDGLSRMLDYIPDGYATYSDVTTIPRLDYGWHKSPMYCIKMIRAFSRQSDIVLDVFCGSGTIVCAAKQETRYAIGFENNVDIAERARERVRNTQPPLFVMQPEQQSFADMM